MATIFSNARWVAALTLPAVSSVSPASAYDGKNTWVVAGQSNDGKTMILAVSGSIVPGRGAIVTQGNSLVAPVAPGTIATTFYILVDVEHNGRNDLNSWRIQVSSTGASPTTFIRGNTAGNPG